MTERPPVGRVIRVLLADDQVLVRKGVHALLALESDIEVIGEAGTHEEAYALAERLCPDVVLIDLMMSGDGIQAIRCIMASHHPARILVLTGIGTDDKVLAAIRAGAVGFLLKDSEPGDLVRAIHEVHRGGAWLHPAIARKLLREISQSTKARPTAEDLTEREIDVLRLVAHGLSNQQIADDLTISEGTVRVHVSNILSKLHLASRTQVALYALREGLASLEDTEPESETAYHLS